MQTPFPEPLFIFEMANNHMGSVEHGLRLVHAMREATDGLPFRFAFKLQYRDLDTFVHPAFRDRTDLRYVKRFQETRLSADQYAELVAGIRAAGFMTVCTPFDERSVDLIEAHGIEVLKVASCSFTDWPLLEQIARSDRPIIASTAGAALEDVDRVVSFFAHRARPLAIMHCVAAYPTVDADLQLNQIDLLRARYPGVQVGYSTHEDPSNAVAVQLAIAKGATLFEKHVGLPVPGMPINEYSADPSQVRAWLEAAARAYAMCGVSGRRHDPLPAESASLRSLRRGVFASRAIRAGETIGDADVFLAFPPVEGQVTANDWSKDVRHRATADIAQGAALGTGNTERSDVRQKVWDIVQAVRRQLADGRIVVPGQAELEISHHYGLERFDEAGLVMITVVNREYCKKLIVMRPGQSHPEQLHKLKEETFMVLDGEMTVALDGVERRLRAGDVLTVDRGVRHRFHSAAGVVFEEISSTHHRNDSYYTDPAIMANADRKTYLTYWMG
jgi:sialic acid synthase SpsE/mannose-6-phosphate isomerase-like protein (cupin superfamily)